MKKEGNTRKKMNPVVAAVCTVVILFLAVVIAAVIFINGKLNKISYADTTAPTVNPESVVVQAEEELIQDTEERNVLEETETNGRLPVGEATHRDNIVNILFLGSDMRIAGTSDKGRADSVMLCSLNTDTGDIKLISFERAIGVPIPGHDDDWLTHSFSYGGAELTTDIIRECFRLDIAGYVNVDFESFADVIDAVGGVDLELTATEAGALNGNLGTGAWVKHPVSEGWNHMDGYDTLMYARLRFIDSDWNRTARQRNVIQAVINQTKNLNIFEINTLADTVLPLVKTDLSKSQIASLLVSASKFLGATAEQYIVPTQEEGLDCYIGEGDRYLFYIDYNEWADYIEKIIYE